MRNVLTLLEAHSIIAAALAGPRTAPNKRIAVAVCDAGGHVLALQREEDAPPLLAHIAMAKASTVVVYGRPTTELGAVADEYPVWFGGIRSVAQSAMGMPLIGSKGGRPIRDESGQLLGAIGIAGETGDQDDVLGKLGVETAGFTTG